LFRIVSKLLLASLALLICGSTAAQNVQVKDGQVIGAGFAVNLPPGISVDVSANSESMHGFYVALPPRPPDVPPNSAPSRSYRYIAFDTKWDLGDMPSLDAAVQAVTGDLIEYVPSYLVNSDIVVDANLPARLGTLPARRLVLKFKNSAHKQAIRQMIIGYRARDDASAIVYLLVLNTTEENFDDDLGIFGKILAGFKVTNQ